MLFACMQSDLVMIVVCDVLCGDCSSVCFSIYRFQFDANIAPPLLSCTLLNASIKAVGLAHFALAQALQKWVATGFRGWIVMLASCVGSLSSGPGAVEVGSDYITATVIMFPTLSSFLPLHSDGRFAAVWCIFSFQNLWRIPHGASP